jgi:hypothetical protein
MTGSAAYCEASEPEFYDRDGKFIRVWKVSWVRGLQIVAAINSLKFRAKVFRFLTGLLFLLGAGIYFIFEYSMLVRLYILLAIVWIFLSYSKGQFEQHMKRLNELCFTYSLICTECSKEYRRTRSPHTDDLERRFFLKSINKTYTEADQWYYQLRPFSTLEKRYEYIIDFEAHRNMQ